MTPTDISLRTVAVVRGTARLSRVKRLRSPPCAPSPHYLSPPPCLPVHLSRQRFHASSSHASSSVSTSTSTSTSGPSTDQPRPPRRPSPYRLLQPHMFLSHFAPLHVKGWRVDMLHRPAQPDARAETAQEPVVEGGELQDRRLVRAYEMSPGKEGWRGVVAFVHRLGELVEEEDHHPTILISPGSDYTPPTPSLLSENDNGEKGYIIQLSTHTHTPLPPYPLPTKGSGKMRPGITGKDISLASRVEGVWQEMRGGRDAVEVKAE